MVCTLLHVFQGHAPCVTALPCLVHHLSTLHMHCSCVGKLEESSSRLKTLSTSIICVCTVPLVARDLSALTLRHVSAVCLPFFQAPLGCSPSAVVAVTVVASEICG